MKKLLSMLVLCLLAPMMNNAFAGPVKITVPVETVFAPRGFDSNDNVEIVVSGFLPNLCYTSPSVELNWTENTLEVELKSLYKPPTGTTYCTQLIVPFKEVISLGMLKKGNYKIIVNKTHSNTAKASLGVSEATSGAVDEFVYANVEYITKDENSREVTLHGYNYSDCIELDRIEVVHNDKDTFSVLPIMKQVSESCPMKMVPFAYTWTVPDELKESKKVLLHVRKTDGRSYNSIYRNF